MIRRFNFTGRKTIPRDRIRIQLESGPEPLFSVQWNPEDVKIPSDGLVYLEAYSPGGIQVERYALGTVGHPVVPEDRSLRGLAPDRVRFDLMVVDGSEHVGRLIAVARGLDPVRSDNDAETGIQSLLPIQVIDLGDQVWRIGFDEIGSGRPVLEVSSDIDGIKALARHDKAFFALVYPQVVREILTRVVIVEGFTDPEDDGPDWQKNWVRWAVSRHPDHVKPDRPESDEEGRMRREWIDSVVAAFCTKHQTVGRYLESFHSGAQA